MIYNNSDQEEYFIEGQLNANVSIISYTLQLLLFFPTLYVNVLVIRMAKRESLSISLELKWISFHCIVSSIWSLGYTGMIKFAFPVSSLVGDWFCETANVLMSAMLFQDLIATNTISIYRYVFIIYREKYTTNEKIKKRVTWTIFLCARFMILVMTAKHIIFNHRYLFSKYWTSVCNGDVVKPDMNGFYNSTEVKYTDNVFHEYAEKLSYVHSSDSKSLVTIFGDIDNKIWSYTLQLFCYIVDLLFALTLGNLTEAILYYKISKYWKR